MSQYKYLTVPFAGATKQSDRSPGTTLAHQLNDLISNTVAQGWEFYRVDHVSIVIKNGCLAALAGNPYSTQTYDMVIFRRPVGFDI